MEHTKKSHVCHVFTFEYFWFITHKPIISLYTVNPNKVTMCCSYILFCSQHPPDCSLSCVDGSRIRDKWPLASVQFVLYGTLWYMKMDSVKSWKQNRCASNIRNVILALIPPWRLWWWVPIWRADTCSLCAPSALAALSQHCGPNKQHDLCNKYWQNTFMLQQHLDFNQTAIKKFTPAIMLQPRFCRLVMMLLSACMFACWMSLARFSSAIPT